MTNWAAQLTQLLPRLRTKRRACPGDIGVGCLNLLFNIGQDVVLDGGYSQRCLP